MDNTVFELEVLGWLMDDYESPSSIAADLARELGREVTEADVADALAALTARGLAQPFRLVDGAWSKAECGHAEDRDGLWFMATDAGRRSVGDAV
jgi:hypothetical protein